MAQKIAVIIDEMELDGIIDNVKSSVYSKVKSENYDNEDDVEDEIYNAIESELEDVYYSILSDNDADIMFYDNGENYKPVESLSDFIDLFDFSYIARSVKRKLGF